MSKLSQLLEAQELDLGSDRLSERRRNLPERESLRLSQLRAGELDEAHRQLGVRREQLDQAEHTLVDEVATIARKAKEVEDTLYGGTVRSSKELTGLQEELRQLREKQSGLEEREMALLEEIEQVGRDTEANRADLEQCDRETRAIEAALKAAEAEIDAELAQLAAQRKDKVADLPAAIVAEYDRLRGRDKLAGRPAALLVDGECGGCRVKLPVLEYNRMKAKPEDTLLTCPRCARVLVR